MFNSLFDRMKKVSEDFEEEHGLGPGTSDDLDLSSGDEPEELEEFDTELINELNLVAPKQKMSEYDEEQLDMGRSVEAEHTTNPNLAVIIAANHLDEIPDYYTRLKEMEEEAKEGEGELEGELEGGQKDFNYDNLEDEEVEESKKGVKGKDVSDPDTKDQDRIYKAVSKLVKGHTSSIASNVISTIQKDHADWLKTSGLSTKDLRSLIKDELHEISL